MKSENKEKNILGFLKGTISFFKWDNLKKRGKPWSKSHGLNRASEYEHLRHKKRTKFVVSIEFNTSFKQNEKIL